jgi:flagellar biosynthetic protein FliP
VPSNNRLSPLKAVVLAVSALALLLMAFGGTAGATTNSSPDNGTGISSTQNNSDQGGYTQTPGAAGGGAARTPTVPTAPRSPRAPGTPSSAAGGSGALTVNVNGLSKPSSSIVIILGLTLLSVAPALLVMLTSFSRIIIVLSLTRNALGLQSIPPNQVLVGLALFLSLFVMAPVVSKIDHRAVQPYLAGKITVEQAYTAGEAPLKDWMLAQTSSDDLALFVQQSHLHPAAPKDVPMVDVVPAFVLSEIKSGFTIGFIIFIPFLVIDLIVSSTLMSMGMMMLPPTLVSLPFKMLLFVMVDGWALVVKTLLSSFH